MGFGELDESTVGYLQAAETSSTAFRHESASVPIKSREFRDSQGFSQGLLYQLPRTEAGIPGFGGLALGAVGPMIPP